MLPPLSILLRKRSLANGESLSSGLLLGHAGSHLLSFSDTSALFEAVELNMAVGGKVWGDATVSTVCSSAAGDGSLGNTVVDNALVDVEASGLGVGAEVKEELTDSLDRLLGPPTEVALEDLALGVSTTTVFPKWDNLSVLKAGLHILDGSVELHTFNGPNDLIRVLVVSP